MNIKYLTPKILKITRRRRKTIGIFAQEIQYVVPNQFCLIYNIYKIQNYIDAIVRIFSTIDLDCVRNNILRPKN